jgi:hypothetical protein
MSHSILKSPGLLRTNYKGLRGTGLKVGVFIQPPVFSASAVLLELGEPLNPGEETEVMVKVPDLKPNASVKVLTAKFIARKGDPGDQKLEQTAEVTSDRGGPGNVNVKMDMPRLPRNVSVRLEGGEVFWTFPGDLMVKEYELPDFSGYVNAYLDTLPRDTEEVSLKFLVKSDTHGSVRIKIDEIRYSLIHTQTWENEMDNTTRFDRNIELDFCMTERLDLDEIEAPGEISINRIEMDLGGDFGEERLLGSVSTYNTTEFATISSEYAAAQEMRLETPVKCSGISGFFQADTEAEIYIEIQNDANGSPAEEPPLTSSNLALAPLAPGEEKSKAQWMFARFEKPIDLKADTSYWIVIKGVRGNLRLGLVPPEKEDYLQQILINRGGQLWKGVGSPKGSTGDTVGQLRLIYIPGIDFQTAAIEIGVDKTTALEKLDFYPGSEEQTVSLDIPGGLDEKKAVIFVKSHAQGTLSIANVIREYLPT